MSRRVLGPDAREFFEAAGYEVWETSTYMGPHKTSEGIAVEPFEVGRLYERIRAIWFGEEAKPAIVELLRAVRLDGELLAALESAWVLGRDAALHEAACAVVGIEPYDGEHSDDLRRAFATPPKPYDRRSK